MANFDCNTENICGKLIWSERLSVVVMCIGDSECVNSFSILYVSPHQGNARECFAMKVKNGNEIIKFALTAAVEQPSRLHARCTMQSMNTHTQDRPRHEYHARPLSPNVHLISVKCMCNLNATLFGEHEENFSYFLFCCV